MGSKLKTAIALGIMVGIGFAIRVLRRGIDEPTVRGEFDQGRAAEVPLRGRPGDVGAPEAATRDELYAEAKRRGIEGRSKMSKAELQAALAKGPPR